MEGNRTFDYDIIHQRKGQTHQNHTNVGSKRDERTNENSCPNKNRQNKKSTNKRILLTSGWKKEEEKQEEENGTNM